MVCPLIRSLFWYRALTCSAVQCYAAWCPGVRQRSSNFFANQLTLIRYRACTYQILPKKTATEKDTFGKTLDPVKRLLRKST